MHGKVDHDADVRHARRERTDPGDRDREDVLTLDRLLDGGDRRIEALDMPDHKVTPARWAAATIVRPSSTVEAIGFSTRTWTPARDTSQRKFMMKVRRRSNGNRVDPGREQFLECRKRSAPVISVARARCAGKGSTMPASLTPGRPASTRP